MKAVLAMVMGALAAGVLLLGLLLVLAQVGNGWPAAALLICLVFFPAFWVIGALAWARAADARTRGAPLGLALLGLDCPRCRHAPMSPLHKWRLGRATAHCRHCGLLLTNDTLPLMVVLSPMLAALLMAPLIGAVVRGISPLPTIGWLLAAGGVVTLFIALTRPFLACEPLAPTAAAHVQGAAPEAPAR